MTDELVALGTLGALLVAGFALALRVRRRLGLLGLAGIAIGVVLWSALWAAGSFEDDREGTAALLSFVYGVPAVAAAWALGVAAAAIVLARRGRS